jgi:hypothetical protein
MEGESAMSMAENCCALEQLSESARWAMVNFGHARLGDVRRTRRLVKLAAAVVESPSMSLPKQLPDWSDLLGAYRLLSNEDIAPQAIMGPHVALTRERAQNHPVVLCVQDDTQLDFTCRTGISGLGMTGDGEGRGLLQHAALAVLPGKKLLGILDLRWHALIKRPQKQKRREVQARWCATDVWQDAANAIGAWPANSKLVHVGDRESDIFRFMQSALTQGHGFVVRAKFDRMDEGTGERLWTKLTRQEPLGQMQVTLGVQRDKGNRVKRQGREACLTIRSAPVEVPAPVNDPRTQSAAPLSLFAVYLLEEDPPAGVEPVEWMLVTSLEAISLEQAQTIIGYYTCRWVIEEWHRCLKEGCCVEASQLDDALDIQRLTSILAIVAVRLLETRDLAESASDDANSAESLRASVPPLVIAIVAGLAKARPEALTLKQFWLTIAKRGGYLGRKHDPRPGWKVLWRGWNDVIQMVRGAELYRELLRDERSV